MRLTAKYRAATQKYYDLQGIYPRPQSQEALYGDLERLGFYWDRIKAEWVNKPLTPHTPANGVVSIRLTAHCDEISTFTDKVIEGVKGVGFRVLEVSDPYPNTRKATHQSRVYMQVIKA